MLISVYKGSVYLGSGDAKGEGSRSSVLGASGVVGDVGVWGRSGTTSGVVAIVCDTAWTVGSIIDLSISGVGR